MLYVYDGATGEVLRLHRAAIPGYTFGERPRNIGDIDGDGVMDYACGVTVNGPGNIEGVVWVYSGASGEVMKRLYPPPHWGGGTNRRFGYQLYEMGDLDGDGYGEFGVGYRTDLAFEIYSGPDCSHLRTEGLWWGAFNWSFGVATVGDVDGDSFPDYVRGIPLQYGLLLVSGATGDIVRRMYPEGQPNGFAYGYEVETFVDVTGDGVPEVLVGAALSVQCSGWSPGRGFLHIMDITDTSILRETHWTWDLDNNSYNYGCEFSNIDAGEDVNGDGYPDYVAGSFRLPLAGGNMGMVHVYSGRTGSLLWRRKSGFECVLTGDLDGDGLSEWAWGDPTYTDWLADRGRFAVFKGFPGDAERVCVAEANSTGNTAKMDLEGPISIGYNLDTGDFGVVVHGGVPNVQAQAIFGEQTTQVPLGTGWLCVGGGSGARRLGGPFTLDQDGFGLGKVDLTPYAQLFLPGTTWTLQVVYDDPGDPFGFNTTDAFEITWVP